MSERVKAMEDDVKTERELVADLINTKNSLAEQAEALRDEIAIIRGEAENMFEEREFAFYQENKKKYSDVNLSDLVIRGKASTKQNVGSVCEYTIANLTKAESLDLDEKAKELLGKSQVFAQNTLRTWILSQALLSYGEIGNAVEIGANDIEAINSINEDLFALIWGEYISFQRWIQAALRFESKNS